MRVLFLLLAVGLACALPGQGGRSLEGRVLPVPPVIDGVIDEAEWAEGARSDGFTERFTQRETRFRTTVIAAYDSEAAYFAFLAYDPEPHLIRATEYRREGRLSGDDRIEIQINPYGTFRGDDFNEFTVNPRGATNSDFAGGRAAKREWQGEWEAAAVITDFGWTAEVRIPWRILRLPGAGARTLTINFERDVPRVPETTQWSSLGPDRRTERHGVWIGVELPLIKLPSIVQALPYTVAGYEEGGMLHNMGADFRHQFGTQYTGLATINPDFRNIEQAVVGIDFSRFERLASERRPFFTEGSDLFTFGGMSLRMFAPQRIGEIDFGAKFFGKLSDEEAIASLVTGQVGQDLAGVTRYRRSWGPNTSMTAGYAVRDQDGLSNHAIGLDFSTQGKRWGIGTNLGVTFDDALGTGERADLDLFYRDGPLFAALGLQRIAGNFMPRLGFAPRRGYQGPGATVAYGKSWTTGPVAGISARVSAEDRRDIVNGGVFLRGQSISVEGALRNRIGLGVGLSNNNFRGQKDRIAGFGIGYPTDDPFRNIGVNYSVGRVEDAHYAEYGLKLAYRFATRLSTFSSLQLVDLGGRHRTQHVFNLAYEVSEFQSLLGRAIYRDGMINWYLAFRQSGNLGIEYYVILGDPNADRFTTRLVLKMVAPFDLALR